MITIEVHFSWAEYRHWTGLTYKQLHKNMLDLEQNIKKATKYKAMFYINDMYNKSLVRVSFRDDCIILWDNETQIAKIKGRKISTQSMNKLGSVVTTLYLSKNV